MDSDHKYKVKGEKGMKSRREKSSDNIYNGKHIRIVESLTANNQGKNLSGNDKLTTKKK
jgi:hypothetical protein